MGQDRGVKGFMRFKRWGISLEDNGRAATSQQGDIGKSIQRRRCRYRDIRVVQPDIGGNKTEQIIRGSQTLNRSRANHSGLLVELVPGQWIDQAFDARQHCQEERSDRDQYSE